MSKIVSLGDKLYELRTARGWTQRKLAEKIGMPLQNYRIYERDRFVPKAFMLLRIAMVLEVDPMIFAACHFEGQGRPDRDLKLSRAARGRIAGKYRLKGFRTNQATLATGAR